MRKDMQTIIYSIRHFIILPLATIFFIVVAFPSAWAVKLTAINLGIGHPGTKVILSFDQSPHYDFFLLHNPERIVLDIPDSSHSLDLPLVFNEQNLLKKIRYSQPKEKGSTRLVFELTQKAKIGTTTQKMSNLYQVIFTLVTEGETLSPLTDTQAQLPSKRNNPFNSQSVHPKVLSSAVKKTASSAAEQVANHQVIVAIDAGHGGQDPGAIGQNGLQEKRVTMGVARKLEKLLKEDPLFKPILTRNGDYFLSVMGRSDVARKQRANVLVSIHADAAPNRAARGASVWVLSNRRANSEMGNWLEQHEKQSELLGGAGDLLANTAVDPYLSKAVLDLQFSHSQRVGYAVAVDMLRELGHVGSIHKTQPEHASLGVLRSPDIPSVLVETGFISNSMEERLLSNDIYQNKIAMAIYQGLRHYFLAHPLQASPKNKAEDHRVNSSARSHELAKMGGGNGDAD